MLSYHYSPSNSFHGFLRFLYDKTNGAYNGELIYSVTSYQTPTNDQILTPDHVFDFQSTNDHLYWIGKNDADGAALTFCLKNFTAKLLGFEMSTYNGDARPKLFTFSSSIDNKTYSKSVEYEADFTSVLTQYFSFNSQPSKCFRLRCLQGTTNMRAFDVDHIEIYGDFYTNYCAHHQATQRNIYRFATSLFYIFLLNS